MGIHNNSTWLPRNVCAGQGATVRTIQGATDWFQIGKGVPQGCIMPSYLFNLYADWKWKWKSLGCVWLFVTPWTIQSIEFSRPEYWSGQLFSSPGDRPNPGIEFMSPTLQADSLPVDLPVKPHLQRTSCEMLGWKKHTLESRLMGEISITSDMQMTPPLWQKVKRNYGASWKEKVKASWKVKEEREKVVLKLNIQKTHGIHSKNIHGIQSHHFLANRWGDNGNSERPYSFGLQIPADDDCSH